MPKKTKALKLSPGAGYSDLVKKIKVEFSTLEEVFRKLSVECYRSVGEHIHKHLLQNKARADYGKYFYEMLEEDTGREKSTLRRIVQFYLAYPILVRGRELTWSHYRKLVTVQDKNERKKLETQIIEKGWNAEKLQEYLNTKRALEAQDNPDAPVPQLKFTRGKLGTVSVVAKEKALSQPKNTTTIDLGFRQWHYATVQDLKEVIVTDKPEYTYEAKVERVVDGDTLWVQIDLGFGSATRQKLRLRGIDCPELDTPEGKKAKEFVVKCLPVGSTIAITTHKDNTDKYDRYLVDLFYCLGETDLEKTLKEGMFLNQELLNEHLAVIM